MSPNRTARPDAVTRWLAALAPIARKKYRGISDTDTSLWIFEMEPLHQEAEDRAKLPEHRGRVTGHL